MARMRTEMTPQMRSVSAVLENGPVHLTAEEILQKVDVSRPTVYRALDRLVALGVVRRLSLEGDRSMYELARAPHAHFLCRSCGRLYDLPMEMAWIGTAAEAGGHRAEKTDVTVYGTCRNCLTDNLKQQQITGGQKQ